MSKISDENWLLLAGRTYLKRFAASGIAFARRYQTDLFFRTQTNIIGLQILYAILILLVAIGSLFVLYSDIVNSVVSAFRTALTATSTPFVESGLGTQLEAARTREIFGVASLVFAAAILFGYLVARLALAPTRNALVAQKQFIGNVAHELRTPLSIIKTNIEIRLLDKDVPAVARKMHESNVEELDRISDIINNLLSLNVLLQPEEIPFERVDLGTIARDVVKKTRQLTRDRKDFRVRLQVAKEHIVIGNAGAIEQILTNLVKNSIRHTPSGEIMIDIAPVDESRMKMLVRDTGSGIRKEDLHRIFEPFYRGDRARSRVGGAGSGLGLAIVRELVKLHKGEVHIQSAIGKGTTVTVILPRNITRSITLRGIGRKSIK